MKNEARLEWHCRTRYGVQHVVVEALLSIQHMAAPRAILAVFVAYDSAIQARLRFSPKEPA